MASCHAVVGELQKRNILLRLEEGRIKADDPMKIVDLLPDLKRCREYILASIEGFYRKKQVRISCPEVLEDGLMHWCCCCEKWTPVFIGESLELSGICQSKYQHSVMEVN